MAVRGAKPKDDDKKVTRHAPTHDWTQVPDKPFKGKRPALPTVRTVVARNGDEKSVKLSSLTKSWWQSISTMPHCVLWSSSDWQFAIATALVADAAFTGSVPAASELRQREKIMGVTVDARRDLRIRYVELLKSEAEPPAEGGSAPSTVTHLADRRQRLAEPHDAS